jgi:hypothetical protein
LLYFITLVFLATWYGGIGDYLRYLFPFAFFFSVMVAALQYRRTPAAFAAFSIVQVGVLVYTLYLLAVPTTYNIAAGFVIADLGSEHALIINTLTSLDLPLNTESALALKDAQCGSKCVYMRAASSTSSFVPFVVTSQTDPAQINPRAFTHAFWIGDHLLKTSCVATSTAVFQGGASDKKYVSVEHYLGDYLLPDFWHLSRLGQNIYVYQVQPSCLPIAG